VRLTFLTGIQFAANYAQFYFKDIVLAGDPNAAQRAPQLMGQLLILVALMLVIVAMPAGLLSDRVGRRAVSASGTVLGILATLLLLFVRNTPVLEIAGFQITDLMAVGLLLGIGAGAFLAVNWAWATDLASREQAGRYLGISNLATAGAGVLAAIGGPLIDWGNAQTMGLGYNIVFVVGALWLAITLLLLPRVRDTRAARHVEIKGAAR